MKNKKKQKKQKEVSTKEIKGEMLKNMFKVSLNLGPWPHNGF